MDIKDLAEGMRRVDLCARVDEVGPTKRVNSSSGGGSRVTEATLKDKTGETTLVLWDDQMDEVKKGRYVQVRNGYVKSFQGRLQLLVGRYGTLEVSEGGRDPDEPVGGVAP